ncbi:MAG: N-acetylmuramoyl-L-alanine amidase, partial [Myxococcota bacterium]|nr:N-acetylmuramoyl-L-alanine amidase [Myxococcota bacterium]
MLCLVFCVSFIGATQDSSRNEYEDARARYYRLKGLSESQKGYRHHWLSVISRFQRISKRYPRSVEAVKSHFTAGELWRELYGRSRLRHDLTQATQSYEALLAGFSAVDLADDSHWRLVGIYEKLKDLSKAGAHAHAIVRDYPQGDMSKRASQWLLDHPEAEKLALSITKESLNSTFRNHDVLISGRRERSSSEGTVTKSALSTIRKLNGYGGAGYQRIVVFLDGQSEIRVGTLAGVEGNGVMSRVFIDFQNTTLSRDLSPLELENNDVVKRVRIAKHNDDRVRVVLDLLDDDLSYDVLPMENPFRLVVDVSRMGNKKKPKPNYFVDGADASLGLVVIDPGHGGKDSGAIGVKGLKEKDVCLQLAISLAEELRSRNVKVELTRESDVFVPLEQRAALANQLGADLFLSVHANALEDQGVAGVETYYLDMTDDRYALRLASVENQINEEKVSEIQLHLANLANQLSTEGSRELAGMIHKAAF